MFISLYVDPELEHWYIIRKIKGYSCYKTITSVSSEAQVKNVLYFIEKLSSVQDIEFLAF